MHSYDGRFDDNILVVGRIGCEKTKENVSNNYKNVNMFCFVSLFPVIY